jgi:hypothetical protein
MDFAVNSGDSFKPLSYRLDDEIGEERQFRIDDRRWIRRLRRKDGPATRAELLTSSNGVCKRVLRSCTAKMNF